MFEITNKLKAKLHDIVVLSQKNRQPDDNPGAKLVLGFQLSQDYLAHFDGYLKAFLFARTGDSQAAKQVSIEGVASADMPALSGIGRKIGRIKWNDELTGYTLTIDHGMGGRRNLVLEDCVLSQWRFMPKEGGTLDVKVNVDSPDVSEALFGKLAKLKSRDIEILLAPPVVTQEELEGVTLAAPKTITGDDGAVRAEGWPFPGNPEDKPAAAKADAATREFLRKATGGSAGAAK